MAKWETRWRYRVRKTTLPGIWEIQTGGYLVRGQVTIQERQYQIQRVLRQIKTPAEALGALESMKREKRLEQQREQTPLFSEFAASLLERKIAAGEIASNATVAKWQSVLTHHLIPSFGDRRIDSIAHVAMLAWKEGFNDRVQNGSLGPRTVNSWLRILSVIFRAASPRYGFPNPMQGIKHFPERERAHTLDEPNRFEPAQATAFLSRFREDYPDHHAMLLVMLVTGARPSTIRPLRRAPPNADYDRSTGQLLLRRSQVIGEPMNATKTGLDQSLPLPQAVRRVLNDHIDRLDASTGPMGQSPLLFPNKHGGYRARSVLDKPMAAVCKALEIPRVSAKGLRRTFKDLARTLQFDKVVEKSISGHMSDKMDFIYGTALNTEKREALESVVRAIGVPTADETKKVAAE